MKFAADHPRGPDGGPMFLGQELCPICECCSLSYEPCDYCGGDGVSGHDCGEDTCCCLDPQDNEPCDICGGEGGFQTCLGGCNFVTNQKHRPLAERREEPPSTNAVDPADGVVEK